MTTSLQIEQALRATGSDKASSHGYHRYYAEVFKDTPESILEVGIQTGKSLAAWRLLFPKCNITGVDITDKRFIPDMIEYAKAEIIISDSTKKEIKDQTGKYDVIIDDGSHFYKDICRTFYQLKDSFTKCYVIEDAMYNQEFIVKFVKRLGFTNVMVYDSRVRGVKVRKDFLTQRPRDKNKIEFVDLKFIVILPQASQK